MRTDSALSNPIDILVQAVTEAVGDYDQSHDHIKGHSGNDCIRCQIVNSLPPWAQKVVKKK
jgi:hypothetical protein